MVWMDVGDFDFRWSGFQNQPCSAGQLVGWLVSLAFEKEISLTWNSQEPNLKWVDGFHGDFHPIFSCNGSESSK